MLMALGMFMFVNVMSSLMSMRSPKRIQHARGWCATVGGGTVHGWRSAYSLRETLSPITGPLDVTRENGASAGQVEETPGRASLEKLGCRTVTRRRGRSTTIAPPLLVCIPGLCVWCCSRVF